MMAQAAPAEEYELRSLGGGMTVIGSPERGFRLLRHPGERHVLLCGKTLDRAYYEAAMGLLSERDIDAAFKPPVGPPREPKLGMVYFIGGDIGGVKIGFASNPSLRVRDLQCGSPIKLRILATVPGLPADERAYHKRFAKHRLHGEWFERCPEILAEIERLSA